MQSTSPTWKGLFASGAALQARATINGVVYTDIGAPVIERATMQGSLAVGNVVSASLALPLRGTVNLPRSAAVVIEVRLSDGQAASEWLPQGTFYISRRMRDPVAGVLALECYDALLKANAAWVPSAGAWPRTLAAVTAELAALLGVALDSRTVIPTGAAYVMSEPAEGTTLRDALSFIAQAAGGNWIMTPAGRLRLVRLGEGGGTVDVAGVVGGIDVGQAGTVTGVRNTADGDVTLTGDDTGIVVDVALTPAIAAAMAEGLIGQTYTPFRLTGAIYDPAAELGDGVRAGAGGEVVSALCSEQAAYASAFRGDIAAPDPGEVTDEYPYLSRIGNAVSLLKANVKEISENAIVRVDVEFAQNQSATVAPAGGWSTDAPQWREGYYIWQRTATTTAEETGYSEPTCISGRDGVDGQTGPQGATGPQGQTGIGVSGVVEQYYLSTSSITPTGGSWNTAQPQWSSGKYIWTRSEVTWTNGTTTHTGPVLAKAINGANITASAATTTASVANRTANVANNTANAASAAVTALDDALNQQEIFNRLTDNGAAQGLVLYNGQLYVNATYINTGYLSATRIKGGTLSLGGLNEERGNLYILDEEENLIGRIYSSGIAFEDTNNLHGVKISRDGVVELSQISVYGVNKQLKAKISPLTSTGIAITDGSDSFATFGKSASSVKSNFSVNDGSGGYLNISDGDIILTDGGGSRIWMHGNGAIEAQADMTVEGGLTVQRSGDTNIIAKCTATKVRVSLNSEPGGKHGIWSYGYHNGTSLVSNEKYMIYRGTDGEVVVQGAATKLIDAGDNSKTITIRYRGDGASATDWIPMYEDDTGNLVPVSSTDLAEKVMDKFSGTMTKDLTIEHSGDTSVVAKCKGTGVPVYLNSNPNGKHGIWSDGYYNGSTFVSNGKYMIYRGTDGKVIVNGTASGITTSVQTLNNVALSNAGTAALGSLKPSTHIIDAVYSTAGGCVCTVYSNASDAWYVRVTDNQGAAKTGTVNLTVRYHSV